MYPLIEIKTVPIEIQMKVTHARLEYARGTAQVEISRDKRGLNIRSNPIKVNIDSFESRNSVMPTTSSVIQQQAKAGVQAAYQATAVLAREGRMMMEARIDQDVIPQLAKQQNIGQPEIKEIVEENYVETDSVYIANGNYWMSLYTRNS